MKWIILIAIVILIIYILIKFRRPKDNCLLGYSGTNGGGKSFSMTCDAVVNYGKAKRYWAKYNQPFWNKPLDLIPYFKKKRINNEMYGIEKPKVYSSYPILLGSKRQLKKYNYDLQTLIDKNIISSPLDNDIMLLKKSIPLQSQVVIDEVSGWINQYEFKEAYSNVLNDHMQKFRHYHGNYSHFYCADQCTNLIPNQIRYRLNKVNVCCKTKHILWFIHITEYKELTLTDDVKNIEVIDNDNSDTDDKILRIIRFSLTRRYDDRAYSNRYFYIDQNEKHSKMVKSIFKTDNTMKPPRKDIEYKLIDNLIEEYYNKQREINVKYQEEEKPKNNA